MNLEALNHAHAFFMGSLLPFVMTPLGSSPSSTHVLRGVVRADAQLVRVAIASSAEMTAGVAAEFRLSALMRNHTLDGVDMAMAYIRNHVAPNVSRISHDPSLKVDSHANTVLPVADASIAESSSLVEPDQELYRTLNLFCHGSALGNVSEEFAMTGFMLQPHNRCRIYVQVADSGESIGLDLPLRTQVGKVVGIGSSLAVELTSKLGSQGTLFDKVAGIDDDYCSRVYDLTDWFDLTPKTYLP